MTDYKDKIQMLAEIASVPEKSITESVKKTGKAPFGRDHLRRGIPSGRYVGRKNRNQIRG